MELLRIHSIEWRWQPTKVPNKAICKIYFKETGSFPKPVHISDSNTSNLFSHLHVYHMEVYSWKQPWKKPNKPQQHRKAMKYNQNSNQRWILLWKPICIPWDPVNGKSWWISWLTVSLKICYRFEQLKRKVLKLSSKSLIYDTNFILENTCPRKPFQICTMLQENQWNHKSAQQIFL